MRGGKRTQIGPQVSNPMPLVQTLSQYSIQPVTIPVYAAQTVEMPSAQILPMPQYSAQIVGQPILAAAAFQAARQAESRLRAGLPTPQLVHRISCHSQGRTQ
jgi:hypothetical protein